MVAWLARATNILGWVLIYFAAGFWIFALGRAYLRGVLIP